MNKFCFVAVFASLFGTAAAQTQVTEFNPGIVAEGVNYALPKTAVNVCVQAMKCTYTPGEYARYAERFLHVSNVRQEATTEWTVNKVAVYQTGVPDTLKYFTIKMKDKSLAPLVTLTEGGIITAINAKAEPVTVPQMESKQTNNKLNSRQYLTADILSATSTAKMAELAAAEIFDIRESKNAIKRGQAESMPQDGASLAIVLGELNQQENALMQLFVGYTDTLVTSEIYTIVPEENVEEQVLFRFSSKLGFVDADNLAGEPYYISVKDTHTVLLPSEKEAAKRKLAGVAYNMPSMANVRLYSARQTLFEKEMPMGQFGVVDVLGSSLFNKGATTRVTFNPATGGLLHLEQ